MTIQPFPPGPRRFPQWRLLRDLQRDPLTFLQEQAATYGDLVHFQIGPRHIYLVNHPDLVKEVLVTQQRKFAKGRALQRAKVLLGEGLLTSEGRYHLQQRRAIQPVFHRRQIATYADCMVAHTARLAPGASTTSWEPNSVVDIHKEMMKLTLAIVGQTLFQQDLTQQQTQIGEAMGVLTHNFQRLLSPLAGLWQRLPTPGNRRLQRSMATLDEVVDGIIRGEDTAQGMSNNDSLSALLFAAMADEPIKEEELSVRLRDEILTLLLAGHETTANALTFTWWLLAEHQPVAERMYAEVAAVLQGRSATFADVSQLPYTRMVFSEALRLYPPAWTIGREAQEAVELGGYTIPAGATVLLSQWVMHRQPQYYPEPTLFCPERWTTAAIATRPHYAFFPFGGGSRLCIGEHFAWMEGVLILATIAQQWRLQRTARTPTVLVPRHNLQPGVTLRPKDALLLRAEAT